MKITKRYIKIGFLSLILSLAVNFAKAQCNANFIDTSVVCGVVSFTNTSVGTDSMTIYSIIECLLKSNLLWKCI